MAALHEPLMTRRESLATKIYLTIIPNTEKAAPKDGVFWRVITTVRRSSCSGCPARCVNLTRLAARSPHAIHRVDSARSPHTGHRVACYPRRQQTAGRRLGRTDSRAA